MPDSTPSSRPSSSTASTVWPERLYIVRHGESAGNVARDAAMAAHAPIIDLSVRDVDVPLSPRGEQQADALGHWFAALPRDERPTVVIASPYLRARTTAERMAAIADFPYASEAARLVVDERFREKEFGILDGLTKYGIDAQYPDPARLRALLGKFYHRPPGGESWTDVILRLRSAFEMLCREYCGQRVLVVCHSVVVLCMRYVIEQLTEEEILTIDRANEIANCSVTRFDADPSQGTVGKLVLRQFNFVAPLEQQGAPVTDKPDVPVGKNACATRAMPDITPAWLARNPLPQPDASGDKDTRGSVLVVGGAVELPGAVVLAGIAALRAGAGKLQLASSRDVVPHIGTAVPEALVTRLAQTKRGAVSGSAGRTIAAAARAVDALLVGPGMIDQRAVNAIVHRVLSDVGDTPIVLDAAAIGAFADGPIRHRAPIVITPHAGEVAGMLGIDKREVAPNARDIAETISQRFDVTIALKGAETFIATPGERTLRYRAGDVGLATSGSGDTLAGVVVGLLARGASPHLAAAWAVYLHGAAGNRLARRIGRIGFLARELLDEVPGVMQKIKGRR